MTIVWIAPQFTDEHRAALDWLNRITNATFNFFALEIELWRIGNSPPAPKFNVVSKPNDWEQTVKAIAGQDAVSPTEQLHLEFWTQFREYMEQRNSRVREAIDQFGNRFQTQLIRGDWKRLPNNPRTPDGSIHEYCPPEFVGDEMEKLIKLHREHEAKRVRPEVEAAWLHFRFTQIHPFEDGNGRVARALATMVFLKSGFLPLVIRTEEHREPYLDALEVADAGDLSPLVNLFANIEITDTEAAITFIRELRGAGISTVAKAAAEAVKRRIDQDESKAAEITKQLVAITEIRLKDIAYELNRVFREAGLTLEAMVGVDNSKESATWWSKQIVSAAKTYQYYADLGRERHWVQLRLETQNLLVPTSHIVVSFHHKESRAGLMAAVVFLTTTEPGTEEGRPVTLGSQREFAYSAMSASVQEEFRKWLETGLTHLLETCQSRV